MQDLLRGRKTRKSRPAAKTRGKPTIKASKRLQPVADDHNWLRIALDEVLERDQPLWRRPAGNFRGSGSGDLCVWSLTFGALGHNVPHDAKRQRIFDTGKAIELGVVGAAKRAKVFVEGSDQLEGVHGDRMIVSHVDMVARRPETGKKYLIEIKSIKNTDYGAYGFDTLPKEHGPTAAGKSPLMKNYRRYVVQWNTYAWSPEVDLEEGCLLFEAKNNQDRKFFWLVRDRGLLDETLARHEAAAEYAFGDPPRLAPVPEGFDPVAGEGECRRCDHRYLCKRLPAGPVEYDAVRAEDAKLRG